ncbi:MAG: hypothetical protein IMZ61_01970 [Planctomycetes bacterium]|nr:hypothetical protein [Planctomycetota bacterium]
MEQDIRTNPIAFRDSFLSEVSSSRVDKDYGAVLRVLLYYLWRGCSLSREAGITGKTDPKASLISQSAYEAILSIIQLIRIGYQVDAATLLRALMERIAIIGYLAENRDFIPRYFEGKLAPYKEALSWAKKKSLPNWMILYSTLSGVAHSRIEGPAGHINNRTTIGKAFRQIPNRDPTKDSDMTEELLGLTVYSLLALDSFALGLIQNSNNKPFSNDPDIVHHVDLNDVKEFHNFLQRLIDRYGKYSK